MPKFNIGDKAMTIDNKEVTIIDDSRLKKDKGEIFLVKNEYGSQWYESAYLLTKI